MANLAGAAGADCAVILTEWNEYRNLDLPRAFSLLRTPILLDTRNVLDPADARAAGPAIHLLRHRAVTLFRRHAISS